MKYPHSNPKRKRGGPRLRFGLRLIYFHAGVITLQPGQESKSRIKAMSQPFWSQYRLRVNDFRVYFDVHEEECVVNVLRVLKKGNASTPQGLS